LVSTPELDMMGMDAILDLNEMKIAIQVKKVSYRREASQRGFTKKQRTYADIIVEAPYLVIDIDEIENKIANSKVGESKKNEYINLLRIFEENFSKLENGFIIFNEKYLNHVREVILDKLKVTEKGEKITYDEILKW